MKIEIYAPIRIKSEANLHEHWRSAHSRRKKNLITLAWYMPKVLPPLPCKITFIRIAPRSLDTDNLLFSLKAIRDYVADKFIPGLKPGRADNSKDLMFDYGQEKGRPKEYGLRIVIESSD